MAHVYILQGDQGRFYIGSTTDLERRMQQHRSGHTPSTLRLGDFALALSQEYATLSEARRVEKHLKNLKRHDYIEKIIKDGIIRTKS